MRAFHRELIRTTRALGGRDIRIEPRGRHPRLVADFGGRRVQLVIPGTPSEYNGLSNSKALLRRLVRSLLA